MKTVLVTGRIGSGKSEACRYLESKGWPVYDCDSRCKRLYDTVPGLKERIEAALGIEFGEIGRIFSDDALRKKLEDIVFPLVREDIIRWKGSLDSNLAFIESAIALDRDGFDDLYDSVLLIEAPIEERARRNPSALQRDKFQVCDRSRADFIIENTSTLDELHKKLDSIYEN